jgi:DNA-binding beta-propeller fold protein YncE
MAQAFQCPNCRASLELRDASAVTVGCQYCGTTVIVPPELRQHTAQDQYTFAASSPQAARLAEIAELTQRGRKIEAIKLFRETFSVGLKEAKEAVEHIERGESLHMGDFGTQETGYTTATTADSAGGRRGCIVGMALLVAVLVGVIPLIIMQTDFGGFVSGTEDTVSGQEPDIPVPTATVPPTPGLAQELLSFGGQEGVGPGYFNDTRFLGLDGEGYIYTGDFDGGRIQVFDGQGDFVSQWFISNRDTPMLAMTADRQGVVSVIQTGDIYRYQGRSGELLDTWASPGGAGFRHLAATVDGGLVAYGFFPPDSLVRFDADGNQVQTIPEILSSQTGDSESRAQVAVDGLGNLYLLAQTFTEVVFKFDADGKFITRIGSEGDEPGQFRAPTAMAVDNQGRVYVADFGGVDVFASDGRYLDTVPFRGVAFDMAFNDRNELFLMDRNGNRVVQYALQEE